MTTHDTGTAELRTERLHMRRWRPSDREPFAALNADPEVMEHFPALMDREASDRLADLAATRLTQNGFGLWAVEVAATGEFIGFVGLNPVTFPAHFTPAMEIGWRLARSAWGHGYATEAAKAALAHAFGPLGLAEIVSFTAVGNTRSRAVMTRIGMTYDAAGDFDHPNIAADSPVLRHVLYRITAGRWRGQTG